MKKYYVIFAAMVLIIFSSFFYENKANNVEFINVDNAIATIDDDIENTPLITNLQEIYDNDEIVGMLEIPNTEYKIIITQSSDNDKYLNYDLYGKKNKIGNPFLDYRVNINEDKKLLIYGHSGKNVETQFNMLENYYDEDYFKEHEYIKLTTDEHVKTYQIFSIYIETSNWDYMKLKYDDDEWYQHLNNLKERSIYDTGNEIQSDDEILILQTCSTKKEYQKYKKKYLLIISRRVD